jgi:hypothetical protein
LIVSLSLVSLSLVSLSSVSLSLVSLSSVSLSLVSLSLVSLSSVSLSSVSLGLVPKKPPSKTDILTQKSTAQQSVKWCFVYYAIKEQIMKNKLSKKFIDCN